MNKLTPVLTVLVCVFISSWALALENISRVATPKLKFSKLSNKEMGVVTEFKQITKDDQGFLWIATFGKLFRYNGYHFKSFEKKNENETISVIDESIYSILFNKKTGLWFGSEYALKNIQNGKSLTFLRDDPVAKKYIDNDSFVQKYKLLPDEPVKKIFIDSNDDIWLGMQNTLVLLNPEKRKIQKFSTWRDINDPYLTPMQLKKASITDIVKDNKGFFWLATRNRGLIKFDKDKNTAKIFKNLSELNKPALSITSLIKRDSNNLLLATAKGLVQFNINTEKFSPFPLSTPIKESLTSIYKANNGDVWVGGKNLFRIDTNNGITEYDQSLDFSIFKNGINIGTIFVDEQETVFVCFDDYGVFRASPYTSTIKLINNLEGTDNSVKAIKIDGNANLWVGYSKGLIRGKFISEKFHYEPLKKYDGNDYIGVMQIHVGKNNNIWVAEEDTINLIKTDGQVKSFSISNNILNSNYIYSLVEDYKGIVWFSVFKGGVFQLDPVTGNVTKELGLEEQELHFWQFIDLKLSENRKLLTYVKSAGGFGEFDLVNKKFTRVYKEEGIRHPYERLLTFKDISAWDVRRAKPGNSFWVTHAEQFISFFNAETGIGETINIPVKEGIVGLLTDKQALWLYGENGGIHYWDRKTNIVIPFKEKDGLPESGVTGWSGVRLGDKNILLGSKKGLVLITPDSFRKNPFISKTTISSVNINNKKIDISKFKSGEINELKLTYIENILEFSFFGTSTSMPILNKFRYRLVGLYDDWLDANDGERKVRYTNLDPGEYVFEVQSSNNDGIWGENVSQTRILISSPYWATPLAYFFYILLLLLLIWIIFKIRTRAIESSNLRLKGLVANKTAKIAKMLDFKNHFLLDLTHEFKTRLQIEQEHLEEVYQYLENNTDYRVDDLRDSNKGMARIVDQLLQLANQQESEHYNFSEINVCVLLSLTAHLFDHLAKRLNVVIELDVPETDLFVRAHEDSFERVFTNLIGNAIKYNKKGGSVTIKAIEKDNRVIISINDTGGGIAGKNLPKNIKYLGAVIKEQKLDHTVVSHGLGLKLVAEDVKINHGDIEAKSAIGIGTTFKLSFQRITPNQQEIKQLSDNTRQMIELEIDTPTKKVFNKIEFQNSLPSDPNRDTIVIIEDTHELLQILATQLKEHFNVVVADDGETGLELCKTICPDIILTDLNMPKLSGFGVIEKIKEDSSLGHIPVVLLTAVANEDVKIKGLELGADDVIAKPVQQAELLKRLQNKLNARNAFWKYYSIENQLHKKPRPSNIDGEVKLTQLEQQSIHVDKWLEKIHNFISDNISHRDKLKVSILAKHMGCSTSFVTTKLKNLTGIVGVKGYMRDYRLIIAHEKLSTQNIGKIEFLAEEHGFSEAQFSKDYKVKYGIPPRETKAEFEAQNQ